MYCMWYKMYYLRHFQNQKHVLQVSVTALYNAVMSRPLNLQYLHQKVFTLKVGCLLHTSFDFLDWVNATFAHTLTTPSAVVVIYSVNILLNAVKKFSITQNTLQYSLHMKHTILVKAPYLGLTEKRAVCMNSDLMAEQTNKRTQCQLWKLISCFANSKHNLEHYKFQGNAETNSSHSKSCEGNNAFSHNKVRDSLALLYTTVLKWCQIYKNSYFQRDVFIRF